MIAAFSRRCWSCKPWDYFDCFGAHANGPDGVGDIDLVAQRYFDLAGRSKCVAVTEFGYGLSMQGRTLEGFDWMMPHTPERQREVLVNGLRWARNSGYVRLVILWNLNYDGGADSATDPNAPYALTRNGWTSPAIPAITQLLHE